MLWAGAAEWPAGRSLYQGFLSVVMVGKPAEFRRELIFLITGVEAMYSQT